MTRAFLASLTRIADFETNPYDVRALEHSDWDNGDYVLAEVTGATSELYQVESCTGEMLPTRPGDQIIGALGIRAATLEGVGSYTAVEKGEMHALTAAGLFGRFTSFAATLPSPMRVDYRGHIVRNGNKVAMRHFALQAEPAETNTPIWFRLSSTEPLSTPGNPIDRLLGSRCSRVPLTTASGALRAGRSPTSPSTRNLRSIPETPNCTKSG